MAKASRIYATVGPFTFAYPHLTAPDSVGKFADNKYKVDGISKPDSAAFKDAKSQIEAAVKAFKLPKDAMLPLKKAMAKDKDGKKAATGDYIFRTKSKFAPAIVDARGTPVPDKRLRKLKIGAGSTGLLQGYFESYTMTAKERIDGEMVETEIPGISFTLTGVQLLSVSAGAGSADFAAYEGGGWSMDDDDDDLDDDDEADGPAADEDDEDDDGGLDI